MILSSVQYLSKSNVCPIFVRNGMLSYGIIISWQNLDKLWIWTMFGQLLDLYSCRSMSYHCPLFVQRRKMCLREINVRTIPGQTLDIFVHLMSNGSFTGQELDRFLTGTRQSQFQWTGTWQHLERIWTNPVLGQSLDNCWTDIGQ